MDSHTTQLIIKDFELEAGKENYGEAELLLVLAHRIEYLIEYQMEYLLSLMYRLDVDESKVHFALSPISPEPANIGLARLVIERQKQRAYTKQKYKQNKLDDLEDLAF